MSRPALALLALLVLAAPARAVPFGPVGLVSLSSGTSGGGDAPVALDAPGSREAITPDGRYVAFTNRSANLTATADANGTWDVFRRDLQTGQSVLVSVNAAGTAASNFDSRSPGISDDGRHVVFASSSTDLVAGYTGSIKQVYVRDMQTGTTTLVSRSTSSPTAGGNHVSESPVISGNGRFVVWLGKASDLESPDVVSGSISKYQLYVRDLQTQTTSFVTIGADGSSVGNGNFTDQHAITPDGRYVSFSSGSTNLVSGYTSPGGGITEVYRRDVQSQTTVLVSPTTAGATVGTNGTNGNVQTGISDDGRYVAFDGNGLNQVAGFTDNDGLGGYDVYLRDVTAGTTTLVSSIGGTATGNGFSTMPRLTPDGRYVLFVTYATDLVPGDANGHPDLLRWDRTTGTLVTVSASDGTSVPATGGTGIEGFTGAISDDGNRVVFSSDTGAGTQVLLRDVAASTTQLVSAVPASATTGGNQPGHASWLSADGSRTTFYSAATDLIASFGDLNGSAEDLYARAVTAPAPPPPIEVDPGTGTGGTTTPGEPAPPASAPPAGGTPPAPTAEIVPTATQTPRRRGVVRRGTRRRDVLTGTPYADRLIGLGGDDSLRGKGGRDVLLGGPGDDRIDAADGVRDVVDCGPGRHDRATVDAKDEVKGCEKVTTR